MKAKDCLCYSDDGNGIICVAHIAENEPSLLVYQLSANYSIKRSFLLTDCTLVESTSQNIVATNIQVQ